MVPNSILACPLSPSAKLVLGLVHSLGKKHGLKLTNRKIGERLGIGPRQVGNCIAELLAMKHPAIRAEYFAGGRVLWPVQFTSTQVEESFQLTAQDTSRPSKKKEEILRETKKTIPASPGADPRHDQVRKTIQAVYQLSNGAICPWDGYAGSALKRLLKKIPWTADEICACVAARFASEVNLADPPESWIGKLPKYRNGPLDRYDKPLEGKYDGIERAFAKLGKADGKDLSAEPETGRGDGVRRVV